MVILYCADLLEVLPDLEESSIDSCITDPPYGLGDGPTKYLGDKGGGGGFMGKAWDHGVPGVDYWETIKRVLKPGASTLVFGGSRTHHRLMVALEDVGFELRDVLMWIYGSGMPHSLNISKAIDKAAGAEREVVGTQRLTGNACMLTKDKGGTYGVNVGTASPKDIPVTIPATDAAKLWDGWFSSLKPAYEPIILAMAPLDGTFVQNALEHGVAGLWVDGCRIGTDSVTINTCDDGAKPFGGGAGHDYTSRESKGRYPANVVLTHHAECECISFKGCAENGEETVEHWNCVEKCPIRILDQQSGVQHDGVAVQRNRDSGVHNKIFGKYKKPPGEDIGYGGEGGSSRFFYCSKASAAERTERGAIDSQHPTVKPLELMRWLCRLTKTPTGGVVLDPFAGSCTTLLAAFLEGRPSIGIEKDPEYFKLAVERLRAAGVAPDDESDDGEVKTNKDGQTRLW